MMFYRRENGLIVGGPYNCDQEFPVEELTDDHPDAIDFNARISAPKSEPIPDWGLAVINELASKSEASADIKALAIDAGILVKG